MFVWLTIRVSSVYGSVSASGSVVPGELFSLSMVQRGDELE